MKYIKLFEEHKVHNIIFTDIDGVLIEKWKEVDENGKPDHDYKTPFIPQAVKFINDLVSKYNCKVICSSSWDTELSKHTLKEKFKKEGIELSGETTHKPKHHRGLQIKNWLDDNKHLNFVILDDENPDIGDIFPNNFIHIEGKVGFSKEKYFEKACKILSKV